jgi:hypothetical protein
MCDCEKTVLEELSVFYVDANTGTYMPSLIPPKLHDGRIDVSK